MSGVVHVASNLTLDPDPNKVISEVPAGVNGILQSAAKEPSVKRFVFAYFSTAIAAPVPNEELTIDKNGWNEADVKAAWAPPPYDGDRKLAVHGSSKTEAEKVHWKFVKEQKPGFNATSVLPNANFGKILAKGQLASTHDWVTSLSQEISMS